MKTFLSALGAVAAMTFTWQRPSEARVYATDPYPYCSVNSSSGGGANCYISSRAQCEFREPCIDNPRYLGAERARAWMRRNKPEWRWWR
jgi:hypothetical protein